MLDSRLVGRRAGWTCGTCGYGVTTTLRWVGSVDRCLDGLGGAVEAEAAGDDAVDVDRARRDERDRGRVGVGVAERGDQVDLVALQVRQREAVDAGGGLPDDRHPSPRADGADARPEHGRHAGALDHAVDPEVLVERGDAGVDRPRRAELRRDREPVVVDVGDDHLGRPGRAGHLGDEQPDRAGAGDQDAVAEPDLRALHGPHRDRQRLDHRADDGVDAVGQRVGRPVRHDEVLGHRPVGGRRAEAGPGRADVVRPLPAGLAPAAAERGLHGDPGADGDPGTRPGPDDDARTPRGRARSVGAARSARCARPRSSACRSRRRRPRPPARGRRRPRGRGRRVRPCAGRGRRAGRRRGCAWAVRRLRSCGLVGGGE